MEKCKWQSLSLSKVKMQNFFLKFKNSANTIAWSILAAAQFLPTYYSSYAILLVLCSLIINHSTIQWKAGLVNPLVVCWAAYLVWIGLSFFWSSNTKEATSMLSTQALLMIIPILYSLRPLNGIGLKWLGRLWYLAAFVAIYWALVYNIIRIQELNLMKWEDILPFFFYTELANSVMHPGYFSLLIIGACFWLFTDVDLPKWAKRIGLVVLLLFLLMLSARMTLLALAVTSFGVIIAKTYSKGKWALMKSTAVISITLLMVWYFLPDATRSRFQELTSGFNYNIETYSLEDYNSITIRLAQWESAFEIILNQPWLGVGAGDYKDALWSTYARNGFGVGIEQSYNTHNQFIENALIAGMPWAIGLLIILIYFVTLGLRKANTYFVAYIVFMFLCFQSETVLFWHRGILFFSLFAVLLYHKEFIYQNTGS